MTVPFTKIRIGQCYEMKSGELRHVVRITPDGDVVFVSRGPDGNARPGDSEQTAGALFAQEAIRPVDRLARA